MSWNEIRKEPSPLKTCFIQWVEESKIKTECLGFCFKMLLNHIIRNLRIFVCSLENEFFPLLFSAPAKDPVLAPREAKPKKSAECDRWPVTLDGVLRFWFRHSGNLVSKFGTARTKPFWGRRAHSLSFCKLHVGNSTQNYSVSIWGMCVCLDFLSCSFQENYILCDIHLFAKTIHFYIC